MPTDPPAIQIEFTPAFKRNLRSLSKKYRNIRSDVQPVINQLQVGELVGDQIPRISYTVFKVRVKNTSIQKGKSGGYRLIYYLKTTTKIILVTIYSKVDQEDIKAEQIKRIIAEFDAQNDTDAQE